MHHGRRSVGVGRAPVSPGSLAVDLQSAQGEYTVARVVQGIDPGFNWKVDQRSLECGYFEAGGC